MASPSTKSPNLAFLAILVVGGLLVLELYQVSRPQPHAETPHTTTSAEGAHFVAAAHGN